MARPNYYFLLELHPSEKNAAKIDAAIRKKQGQWTRERNHPSKGTEAQKYLELLKDIKQVMGDAELRSGEARECKRLQKEKEKQAYQELDEYIETLSTRGHVFEKELATLAKQFKGVFTEQQIRGRIKVPVRKASGSPQKAKPTLENSTARKIDDALKLVGKKDLYDFLDLPPNSSLASLDKRTREIDSEIRKKNVKDAVVTAKGELVGFCLSIFKSEDERVKYGNTCEKLVLMELDPLIRSTGASGSIASATISTLIRKARERGSSEEAARGHIMEFAVKHGISVEVPASGQEAQFLKCGTCGVLTPHVATNCSDCGEPLVLDCPKCGTQNPSENQACTKCGFSIGDAVLVRRLTRESDLALAQGNLEIAEQKIREAMVYWGDTDELKARLNLIQQRNDELKKAVDDLQDAIDQRKFIAAQGLLETLANSCPTHSRIPRFSKKVEDALKSAESHTRQANAFARSGKTNDAVDAYAEAVRDCADFAEAIAGLAKHPPQPPSGLAATVTNAGVSLNWRPANSRGRMKYHVVRKTGSAPHAPGDGETIASVEVRSLTDADAPPGEVLYYAVFSDRGGTVSQRPATAAPVVRVADVGELKAVGGESCVSLNWQTPSGAIEVEVWKQDGASPRRRGEGVRIKSQSMNSVTDRQVTNGRSYGYRVIAVFPGVDGGKTYASGVAATTIPMELPKPVRDLTAQVRDTTFQASWTPLRVGEVQVRFSSTRPTVKPGETMVAKDVDQLGRAVPVINANTVQGDLKEQKLIYLIPVTVAGTIAVAGESISVSCVPNIEDLSVTTENEMLVARWKWPSGARNAVVAIRPDRFPTSAEDQRADRVKISQHKYDVDGAFRHRLAASHPKLYIVVFVMIREDGEAVYSSAASPGSRVCWEMQKNRTVRYRLDRPVKTMFSKLPQFQLTLTADADTKLPDLILVGREGGPPLDENNGQEVIRVPKNSRCSPDQPLKLLFDAQNFNKTWKFKLFAIDDSSYEWLDLSEEPSSWASKLGLK